MKKSFLFFWLLIAIDICYSQDINTILMHATYKIEMVDENKIKYKGTCFIIGRPSTKIQNLSYYVLVTAKHNLTDKYGDYIIINLRKKLSDTSYGSFEYPLKIKENGINKWTSHPDTSVDVAVMYVALPDSIDIDILPIHYLAKEDYLKYIEFHTGDNVNLLGYPYGKNSPKYNFPILTSGKISSYPLFPAKNVKYYLIDINSFPGNSGGPVYIYETGRSYAGEIHFDIITFRIIGLLSGQMYNENIYEFEDETITVKKLMNIHYIVPSVYILESIELLPDLDL
ncbi:MAG TPA: serine protease [Ignavibacteria bacterium]